MSIGGDKCEWVGEKERDCPKESKLRMVCRKGDSDGCV
jgi:hypothetical protein